MTRKNNALDSNKLVFFNCCFLWPVIILLCNGKLISGSKTINRCLLWSKISCARMCTSTADPLHLHLQTLMGLLSCQVRSLPLPVLLGPDPVGHSTWSCCPNLGSISASAFPCSQGCAQSQGVAAQYMLSRGIYLPWAHKTSGTCAGHAKARIVTLSSLALAIWHLFAWLLCHSELSCGPREQESVDLTGTSKMRGKKWPSLGIN